MQVEGCKWSYEGDDTHRMFIIPGPFKKAGVNGKKICMDCCRFLGWDWADKPAETTTDKPEAVYPKRDLMFLLQKKAGELNEWETKFLGDLSKRNVWSPKQDAAFEKIRAKFFEITTNETKKDDTRIEQPAATTQSVDDDFYVPF